MKRIMTIFIAALMLVSVLSACSDGNNEAPSASPSASAPASPSAEATPEASPEPSDAPRENFMFTDDCGREVEVDGEITRIAASGPMSQIALFGLAPEMLVGISIDWQETARGIIPEEYFELPLIGQIYGGKEQVNLEELALLDPQLVIDIGEAKGTMVEDLDALQEQTGVTIVHVEATLETMPQAYRTLGKLLGKEAEGEAIAQYCEKIWDRTMAIMDKVGDDKASVVYCLGTDGLNVLAQTSFHAELIDMMTNNLAVVEDVSTKGTGNPVDMEQLLLWNPDYIVFSPDGGYDAATGSEWQQLTAIQNGNYASVPAVPYNWMGSPPSAQRYLGLIWLPAVLYPDYVDYDVFAECAEYFEIFYHTELTREMFDSITATSFIK